MYSKEIIFLIWSDKPGGIEVTLPDIISSFSDKSFSVFVLRKKNKDAESVFRSSHLLVNYAEFTGIRLYLEILNFFRKRRYKIVHGFNLGPFVLFTLLLSGVKNIVYSIHGTIYWKTISQKLIRKIFWGFSLSNRILFIANSEHSKKMFLERVSDKPIRVIYNPFDTSRFKLDKPKSYDTTKLKICYTGRLANGKNLFKWIDIAEEVLKVYQGFTFNIYGDGPLKEELNNYIKNKSLVNKIFLAGFRKDIENVYKENDLLLFLSEYESFGNVVVESILCGTPVIASKIPAMEEIFKDYPEFLVNLDEDLSKKVISMIGNYEKLRDSATKASKEFAEKFSMEKHLKELEKIYNSFD